MGDKRCMHVVKHVGNVTVLDILKLGVPRLCSKGVENIEKLSEGVGDGAQSKNTQILVMKHQNTSKALF